MKLFNVPNDIIMEYFYWIEMVDMIALSISNKQMYNHCKNYYHFNYFLKHRKKICCSEHYSMIIKNYNLYLFGFNILTNNNTINKPKKLNNKSKIFSISCSSEYALITSNIGTYSIGNYDMVQLNYKLNNIIATYCGDNFSLIYTKNHLYSFGCNINGQLGLGYISKIVTQPTIITFFNNHIIKHISLGHEHTIITTNYGTYVYGANNRHQLGLKEEYYCTPQLLDIKNIISSSCGGNHTLVLTLDGLYGCGSNIYGELGLPNQPYYKLFTKININNVISVKCGYNFTFITTETKLYTYGDNYYGQLSTGNFKFIQEIECGYNHTIIKVNDNYYGMGSNKYNQLGLGNFKNKKYKIPKLIRF